MNKWYKAPADASIDLLSAMAKDTYRDLPHELMTAIRTSATSLAKLGRSDVWENGLPLDYPTLISLTVRFATSGDLRESARTEQVQRNRHNFLYRR